VSDDAVDRVAVAATVLGSGMAILDQTVVNTALPSMARDLGLALSGMQWVVSAYVLTLGSLLLLGGALGDRYGRQRMFMLGLALFAATSALCAVAPSGGVIIAARALQGAAGALLTPNALALLSALHHGTARARAIGLWSGLSSLAAAAGPLAGGILTEAVSWRAVFLINVPVSAVALLLGARIRSRAALRDDVRLDLVGGLLAAAAFAALAFALIESSWTAAAAVPLLAAAYVWHERRTPSPLVPPALLRRRDFLSANVVTVAVYGATTASFFVLGLELQTVQGYSPVEAGAAALPVTIALLLLSPRSGALAARYGARTLIAPGCLLLAAGLAVLSLGGSGSYVREVLPGVTLVGLGMAGVVAPITSAALAAAPAREQGIASGVNTAAARLAGLVMVAAFGPLADLAYRRAGGHGNPFVPGAPGSTHAASHAAFVAGLRAAAVVSVVGAAVAWRGLPGRASTTAAPVPGRSTAGSAGRG
jgi:EmrB/QacA subfamily drug resistance transporter